MIFVRGHQAGPAERTVLRCLTTDLTNWTSETNGSSVCPTVLAPDALEHQGTDYYTSGATVYVRELWHLFESRSVHQPALLRRIVETRFGTETL